MCSNGLSNIAKGFKDGGFQLVTEGILHRDGLAKQGHRYKIVDLDRLTLRQWAFSLTALQTMYRLCRHQN